MLRNKSIEELALFRMDGTRCGALLGTRPFVRYAGAEAGQRYNDRKRRLQRQTKAGCESSGTRLRLTQWNLLTRVSPDCGTGLSLSAALEREKRSLSWRRRPVVAHSGELSFGGNWFEMQAV